MYLTLILILSIISKFGSSEYLDTDCYKNAGNSIDSCKKFTTFVNGTEENFFIEPNVLYLCCYVDDIIDGHSYQGCLPIKEDVVWAKNSNFNFNCFSNILKITQFLKIIALLNIFL